MQTHVQAPAPASTEQTRQQQHQPEYETESAQLLRTPQFEDGRPEVTAQLHQQSLMANSPRTTQLRAMQSMMANSPRVSQLQTTQAMMAASPRVQQLKATQTFLAAGTSANQNHQASVTPITQRMEDEEPLQSRAEEPVQREQAETSATDPTPQDAAPSEAPKPNNAGLPDNLKTGIENLSGISMDHVKVHYNSDKPAQLQAYAYAQGSEIHVAPGQEQHLPHEAWHVVQQAQGRVKPTVQMKGGVVNDDSSLEEEADTMGRKAAQFVLRTGGLHARETEVRSVISRHALSFGSQSKNVLVQRHAYSNTKVVKKINGAIYGDGGAEVSANFNANIKAPIKCLIEADSTRITKEPFRLYAGHLVRRSYGGAGDVPNILLWSEGFETFTWPNSIESAVEEKLIEAKVDDMRAELEYRVTGEDSDKLATEASLSLAAKGENKEVQESASMLRNIPHTVNVEVCINKYSVREDDESGTVESLKFGEPEMVVGNFTAVQLGVPVADDVIRQPVVVPPIAMQMKGEVQVNDDGGLEIEADSIGAQMQLPAKQQSLIDLDFHTNIIQLVMKQSPDSQNMIDVEELDYWPSCLGEMVDTIKFYRRSDGITEGWNDQDLFYADGEGILKQLTVAMVNHHWDARYSGFERSGGPDWKKNCEDYAKAEGFGELVGNYDPAEGLSSLLRENGSYVVNFGFHWMRVIKVGEDAITIKQKNGESSVYSKNFNLADALNYIIEESGFGGKVYNG